MSPRTALFSSVIVAAGAAIAWLSAPPAVAQVGGGFGGGGLGSGGFGGGGLPQSFAGEQIMQGGGTDAHHPSFFLLTAPDKSRAWGYSTANGDWKKAPLDDKAETAIVPIVGQMVAVIAEGRKVHGFSSLKGEWATLELPEGTQPEPIVGTDYAQIRTPTSLSIFSARTGNWATVEFAQK